ncbi:hypothetical protein BDFB_011885 [Asbolus verrucosus]|uniref:Uncharacterized protein n=1 Tax=Asbolus verrucosus TaxID=1661398 RepID=A0A482VTM6_ASBVE|nr:hypothetical protein BDFB_011885 [Asbolus verrucosus]
MQWSILVVVDICSFCIGGPSLDQLECNYYILYRDLNKSKVYNIFAEHLIDVEDTSNEKIPPRNPTPAILLDYQEDEVQAAVIPTVPFNNYILPIRPKF